MFYYPTLLKTPNLVNLQVVFPGGWGQLGPNDAGLHFLWETLFFAPTANMPDPDKWLWEHTLDFWSVTSYESIRLNFTLNQDQIAAFVPALKALLPPRRVAAEFIEKEIKDLKHYWQTDRDQREDQVLRELFKAENVVHPNANLIFDLTPAHVDKIQTLWQAAQPHIIILGKTNTDDLIALGTLFTEKTKLSTVNTYHPPTTVTEFFTPTRWGLKFSLTASHLFELLVIELWEQQFKAKFFFEYHDDTLYIWTNEMEQPHLLAQKIKSYPLQQADFQAALNAYLKFLNQLYQGANSKTLEKLAELTEGLHTHAHQSPTVGVDPNNLNLADTFSPLKFDEFKTFYQAFTQPLGK